MRSHGVWRHPQPVFRQSPFRARLPKSPFYVQFPPQKYPITSVCRPATGSMSALGSWLRENSEIEFANGNFVSTSINLKNESAGDGCRDKIIKKTILRAFRARTFSRGHGQKRTLAVESLYVRSALNNGHRKSSVQIVSKAICAF
jgi:hypothetical protein